MNKRLIKLTIGILLISLVVTTCNKSDKMTIEMEIYYNAFENLVNDSTMPLKVLIRVPGHFIDKFEFGTPVIAVFKSNNSQLVLDTLIFDENHIIDSNKFMLKGSFLGVDENTKDALVGFKFRIANSKKPSAPSNGKTTTVIVASFTNENNKLIFENINTIKSINKKPIMFK